MKVIISTVFSYLIVILIVPDFLCGLANSAICFWGFKLIRIVSSILISVLLCIYNRVKLLNYFFLHNSNRIPGIPEEGWDHSMGPCWQCQSQYRLDLLHQLFALKPHIQHVNIPLSLALSSISMTITAGKIWRILSIYHPKPLKLTFVKSLVI